MNRKALFLIGIFVFLFLTFFLERGSIFHITAMAQEKAQIAPVLGFPFAIDPYTYGNVVISRNLPKSPMAGFFKPVVFPHWWHRTVFTCKVCHADIGFIMKAGADNILMTEIQQGKWCGNCHNGEIAFAPVLCPRCHSKGLEVKENRNPKEHLSKLPKNTFGNKVDWVKAINDGSIKPKASIDGKSQMTVFDRDIEFRVQRIGGVKPPLPDVIFPHKQHTQWLFCTNCHPEIFQMKAGANPVTMLKVFEGEFCGRCHGKVAFPLLDCLRCHNEERLNASYKKKIPPADRGK